MRPTPLISHHGEIFWSGIFMPEHTWSIENANQLLEIPLSFPHWNRRVVENTLFSTRSLT